MPINILPIEKFALFISYYIYILLENKGLSFFEN